MRHRGFRHCPAAPVFALAMVPVLCAQSDQITRADGTAASVTAAQIAALPHVSVNVIDHDTPAQFDGVPLSAVLKLAGIETGGQMKGPQINAGFAGRSS